MSNNTLSDNKLSDIDLEYLINKELYGKSIDSKMQPHINTNNKKDKKFYKKRIYDLTKQFFNAYLLNQINISSLIILVGVAYEIQKTVRSLFNNILAAE